ncbi:unnamed protein product [Mycena citricolor]|uniref:Uncharacterized protein n=1 Tax=Mycena citricolor TaxID=2018698 RepID=A0AAD2HLH9_9AGAR|nr:unnamed protein product [Mycena citricolor]
MQRRVHLVTVVSSSSRTHQQQRPDCPGRWQMGPAPRSHHTAPSSAEGDGWETDRVRDDGVERREDEDGMADGRRCVCGEKWCQHEGGCGRSEGKARRRRNLRARAKSARAAGEKGAGTGTTTHMTTHDRFRHGSRCLTLEQGRHWALNQRRRAMQERRLSVQGTSTRARGTSGRRARPTPRTPRCPRMGGATEGRMARGRVCESAIDGADADMSDKDDFFFQDSSRASHRVCPTAGSAIFSFAATVATGVAAFSTASATGMTACAREHKTTLTRARIASVVRSTRARRVYGMLSDETHAGDAGRASSSCRAVAETGAGRMNIVRVLRRGGKTTSVR